MTVFAYLLIVAGLFWVTMPYLLRDQIQLEHDAARRWRWRFDRFARSGLAFVHLTARAILVCAVTRVSDRSGVSDDAYSEVARCAG